MTKEKKRINKYSQLKHALEARMLFDASFVVPLDPSTTAPPAGNTSHDTTHDNSQQTIESPPRYTASIAN